MISLLERIAAFQDSSAAVLGPRAGELLEWSSVTGQVASFCLNGPAADAVLSRRPYDSLEPIVLQQSLADELRPAGDANQWPPLADVGLALDLVRQPPPVRLEGADLVHIASVAEQLDRLRAYFLADRARFALWGEAAIQLTDFSGLSGTIRRALDRDGSILDGASPLLSRLRRAVAGQERVVRREITQAMNRARAQGWTTGDEVTLRGDRFCLPLRSGDSRRIEGIVHDRSATGATLFVEPAGVVRLANELTATRLEIATEEARILFQLNRSVEQAASALENACEVMILLDTIRAPMLWSRQVHGCRPRISDAGEIRICGGRHPLLMEALGEGDRAAGRELVVPLDLEIPPGKRALVISGPNAGGKSVALKSVGVFCLMAQCGWDVPVREDTVLPLITRLLVDLGDEQSIAQSLSSFSAHLHHLGRFMAEAGPGTLVLCDEIGSGTDPQEGTALAFAVLAKLTDSGALVLASTHFGLLKAAVHDHPRMVNAAMDYDERDLRPLFTFRVGDPGTSHAFDIAARMGFPEDLLGRARRMAGEERVQIENLLADLDRRARELASAQEEARRDTARIRTLGEELDGRLSGLKKERRELLKQASREAGDLVRQGRRAIEQAVREIKVSGADKTVVKSARRRLDRLDRQLTGDREEILPPALIEPGQRVRIPHLGLIGNVVEVRGDRILATAGGLRLTLGREAVRPLEDSGSRAESTAESSVAPATGDWAWHSNVAGAEPEIDLRGESGEDGWCRLDKLIDRAIPAGLEVINVIHGFGTGRLRDHLHECLKKDPRVASFKEAGPGQGGGGATLVTLAG